MACILIILGLCHIYVAAPVRQMNKMWARRYSLSLFGYHFLPIIAPPHEPDGELNLRVTSIMILRGHDKTDVAKKN